MPSAVLGSSGLVRERQTRKLATVRGSILPPTAPGDEGAKQSAECRFTKEHAVV